MDDENEGPRRLPIVCVDGVEYFVDIRLRQLRDVGNPHRFLDFIEDRERWIEAVRRARQRMQNQ